MSSPNIHHLGTGKTVPQMFAPDDPEDPRGVEAVMEGEEDLFDQRQRNVRPPSKGGGASKQGGLGSYIWIAVGISVFLVVVLVSLIMYMKKQTASEMVEEDFGVPPTVEQPAVVSDTPKPPADATASAQTDAAMAAAQTSAVQAVEGTSPVVARKDDTVQQVSSATQTATPPVVGASASEIKDLKDQIDSAKAKMSVFDERLGNLERELTSLVAVVKQSLNATPRQSVKTASAPVRTVPARAQGGQETARKPENVANAGSVTVRQPADAGTESVQVASVKPVVVKAEIPNRLLQDVHVTQLVGSRAWVTEVVDGAEVETSLVAGDVFRGVRVQSISTQYREVLLADGRKIIRRK